MSKKEYSDYVNQKSPNSPIAINLVRAFLIGGLICCAGQAVINLFSSYGLSEEDAATATSITLVFIGALLTGLGLYHKIARFAGAGTLVPITGFANSVVAPALEFKTEGMITGTAAKMFIIAGPVIVFGTVTSVLYGIILVLFGLA